MPPAAPSAFLLDLDGTLYSADKAIPGAADALSRLRRNQIPFRLVTNTTSRSRRMLVERLAGYGLSVAAEEIVTATLAGATLLRARGFLRVAPFVPPAALEDLTGLTLLGGTTDRPAGPAEAVVLGDLGERWTYALLQEAFDHLMAGAALVALSRDRYFRQGERLALDAGPFVAALEYAANTSAEVAGKPSPAFFAAAVTSLGLPPDRSVAMVGDDLWSDVEGAQRAGLQGWLVRTGKFREDVLRSGSVRPDRVLESVAVIGS
ncbi:MAG TPA: TIGR01458 family HAD-type hydrolase [Gemmatimonadales bacterium]|nr:TIGR01458 family HAD-type hydrolase [Gemmatimonadales bacterium]